MRKTMLATAAAALSLLLFGACSKQDPTKEAATPDVAQPGTEIVSPEAPKAPMEMAKDATVAKQEHSAMGTVTAVDPSAGTVTIKHEAVERAGWPAMTMTFKIDANRAAGLKPNEQVQFKFMTESQDTATVTSIEPMSEMKH